MCRDDVEISIGHHAVRLALTRNNLRHIASYVFGREINGENVAAVTDEELGTLLRFLDSANPNSRRPERLEAARIIERLKAESSTPDEVETELIPYPPLPLDADEAEVRRLMLEVTLARLRSLSLH